MRVNEARAHGLHVEGRALLHAELGLHQARRRRKHHVFGGGGDDDQVDVGWRDRGSVHRALRDGDGPVIINRQWYEQFYVDAEQVPEKQKARRVLEIDKGLEKKPELKHAFDNV